MVKTNLSISYKSKRNDFPTKWSDWDFELHKVRLFQEQIQGWIIDVAKEIKQRQIGHADFAILSILLSYFENIGKYKVGYGQNGKSDYYFRKGLRLVYPSIRKHGRSKVLTKLIYDQARCGMYHVGFTGNQIVLDCSISKGIKMSGKMVKICPEKLIIDLQSHFNQYCKDLKNSNNKTLRTNFEKRIKFVWGVK